MIRVYASIIAAVGLIFFGFKVHGWRADARQLPIVQKAYDEYVTQAELNLTMAHAASKGFQDELDTLRKIRTASGPAPVVRLCPPPKPAPAVRPGHRDPGPETPAAPAGILPPGGFETPVPGPDIGPGLLALFDAADDALAQGRASQDLLERLERASRPSDARNP